MKVVQPAYGSDNQIMESAAEWDRCLGWTFELISEDPVRREQARGRLRVTQDRRSEALYAFNEVWRDEGLSAADQAGARYIAERRRTLPDALWEFIPAESYADWAGLKYVLLYLEWEARYPDEWMASAKGWGTKHDKLDDLARAVPHLATAVIDQLVDLISLAVRREHRCEDVGYAVLARAVGGSRLRRLLLEIADDPDEGFRLRARYLLWLLDHPEASKPKASQWKAWLRSQENESAFERAEPVP
ncbi:hypothetical protein GCM10009555_060030 [Acrocarpospora macrocephala]|uniref:Uncharacterized protein n=1 Tax=Acrocarpospora macrocephala TaxID=150177 RepID=A0A5M3WS44_9ACTN|nr:hypothetical protein [Acrocarpospora macrocephala]GES10131.1 hypothetical protein Amac_037280 [Acrocarpospora macrocephala]